MLDFTLTFDAITLTRADTQIVQGLDMRITNNELLWIRGANGIGKSSLLRLAAGLLRPDAGRVNWEASGQEALPAALIGYQGHKDTLKPALSIFENLAFWTRGVNRVALISQALDKVGLSDLANQRAGTLSAGQSRRAALAKLILDDKPLWILDEPTAAMDDEGTELVHGLITSHVNNGGAVLIASHAAPQALAKQARILTLESAPL